MVNRLPDKNYQQSSIMKKKFSLGQETPFFRKARYSWLFDLTPSSRALFIGSLIAIFNFAGYHSTNVDTYILIGFFAVLGGFSLALVGFYRPNLELTHTLPSRAVCGEKFPFSVLVKNTSSQTAWDLVLQAGLTDNYINVEPEKQFIPYLKKGEEQDFYLSVHFNKRGNHVFPGLRIDTTFPFGLFCLGCSRQGETLLIIYPLFFPLENLTIPIGRKYHPGGVALVSQVGDSMEYIGNREYHKGDDLRKIDWRSWARLQKPIVREYQQEYFCRVALVLDTQMPPFNKKRRKKANEETKDHFEASLSLSAAIADFLSRQEHIIDIFAAGPQIYLLESGRSLAHMDQILEVLACLEFCQENPFAEIESMVLERMSLLTSVIVVLLQLDSARVHFLEKLSQYDVGLKVILCTSEQITNPFEGKNRIDFQTIKPDSIMDGKILEL